MKVLYFGTYSIGPGYPRNTVLIESLRAVGVDVTECRAPLFRGPADKIAAVAGVFGATRSAFRAAIAWGRLSVGFFTAGPRDAVVVGYTGHLDIFLARALSLFRRRPIVLDAFLSPYDTIVGDRKILRENSWKARALKRFERASLRVADLVLTDTDAGADYLHQTFDVPREKLASLPVGSLVREPVEASVPAAPGEPRWTPTGEPRAFEAIFVGSFVPLQGVPYILAAAELAPDLIFRIVGDGPDGPRAEEEVRERRMRNVVLERRFVQRAELNKKLADADAVLGVFGTGPKTARVIPCKVYDGLAAGLPVVTARTPAACELMTDGEDALLVDAEDPGSLVAALRRLRDEPLLRETLRSGARRLARERFGAHAIGMRYRASLKELVRR
ncbi:MAG: glycosyltransferase [Planctomycetota bacterium]